mmetsp:Transcript_24842/g.52907  ORF Transcript_24842/g.52907 Transcript_24842/m.52907 type:complete len:470 (-) Transcript_24842:352-1761(-)|eukprot:CAMPEP_0206499200 /NCGR_PEP_ID=MMETSP0324_2-20121206/51546_1 /ASSEMBLY_ACC=CAM_ASM_000836 /TAXON_ID=2866 /ORGANISM="Crypthecodinium cohnii, Strain Seligo" /LENGTH=469 /DNA_ID=CAMNT_0053985729 /DNA_START=176 /DNA_END=1585 /DNA_ORIENTATION=-
MPPKGSTKAAAAKAASAKGKAKAKAKAASKVAAKEAVDNAVADTFEEVDFPSEVLRRVIPKDAGMHHVVHAKVRLVDHKCRVAFSRGNKGVIWFTTTVEECGSSAAALRLARSMFLRLEEGASKEEVFGYKDECCRQLQEYVASLSGPPATPHQGEIAASTPSSQERNRGTKRPHGDTTSPGTVWAAGRRSSVSSAASPYPTNNLERAAPPSVASTADTETESIKLANEAKNKIISSKENILRQCGIVPAAKTVSGGEGSKQEEEADKETSDAVAHRDGTSDGIASADSSRSSTDPNNGGDVNEQGQQLGEAEEEAVAHTPHHEGKSAVKEMGQSKGGSRPSTPAAGRCSTGKPPRDAVSFQSGVRSLKESLTAQNLDTSGSWSELVARLEKAEAEGPVQAPTPSQVPPGPGVGSRSPGACTRSPGTGGRTPKQTTPKLARMTYAFQLQKRLASKRPPATPQRLGTNSV